MDTQVVQEDRERVTEIEPGSSCPGVSDDFCSSLEVFQGLGFVVSIEGNDSQINHMRGPTDPEGTQGRTEVNQGTGPYSLARARISWPHYPFKLITHIVVGPKGILPHTDLHWNCPRCWACSWYLVNLQDEMLQLRVDLCKVH